MTALTVEPVVRGGDENASSCGESGSTEGPKQIQLTAVNFIAPMTVLIIFNLVTIAGNSLVVAAVFTHKKLLTITNKFIVSLAMADLLVGVVVLPFSSANEVLGYWPFGTVWCSAWLAVDVWLCTASILNLCVISFDRYLAISRPFRYPTLMSPARAKLSIALVWTLSLAISLPPLLGWKDREVDGKNDTNSTSSGDVGNYTSTPQDVDISGLELLAPLGVEAENSKESGGTHCANAAPVCVLTSESGYIIYSACGSFWIPMFIMVFFYIKIYRTAVKATDALRRGVVTTKTGRMPSSTSDSSVNLRVHRGGGSNGNGAYGASRVGSNTESIYHSTTPLADTTLSNSDRLHHVPSQSSMAPDVYRGSIREDRDGAHQMQSLDSLLRTVITEEGPAGPASDNGNNGTPSRRGMVQIRTQLRRLNREKKAAKTVGIIVGCFVVCWTPFFTVYILGAFCVDCTPGLVFTVFFWLGYCNSAINPFIYALCSRDFRYAFQKLLLCRKRSRTRLGIGMLITGLRAPTPLASEFQSEYLSRYR